MIFRLLIVAYAAGVLVGSLSIIEWLADRMVRLWLDGRLAWLEVRLVRMWRRIGGNG